MRIRPVFASVGLLAVSLSVAGCRTSSDSMAAKPTTTPPMIGRNGQTDTTTSVRTPAEGQGRGWPRTPVTSGDPSTAPTTTSSAGMQPSSAAKPHAANPGRTVRAPVHEASPASYTTLNPNDTAVDASGSPAGSAPGTSATPPDHRTDTASAGEGFYGSPENSLPAGSAAPYLGSRAGVMPPSTSATPKPPRPESFAPSSSTSATRSKVETQYHEVRGTRAPGVPAPTVTEATLPTTATTTPRPGSERSGPVPGGSSLPAAPDGDGPTFPSDR